MFQLIKEVLIKRHPHLADGVLEEFLKAYFIWIAQTVLAIAGTLVVLLILVAIFNNVLNIVTGNKKAARKFWTAIYKKF